MGRAGQRIVLACVAMVGAGMNVGCWKTVIQHDPAERAESMVVDKGEYRLRIDDKTVATKDLPEGKYDMGFGPAAETISGYKAYINTAGKNENLETQTFRQDQEAKWQKRWP